MTAALRSPEPILKLIVTLARQVVVSVFKSYMNRSYGAINVYYGTFPAGVERLKHETAAFARLRFVRCWGARATPQIAVSRRTGRVVASLFRYHRLPLAQGRYCRNAGANGNDSTLGDYLAGFRGELDAPGANRISENCTDGSAGRMELRSYYSTRGDEQRESLELGECVFRC